MLLLCIFSLVHFACGFNITAEDLYYRHNITGEFSGIAPTTQTPAICGNAIKEDGEECDCGNLRSCLALEEYCCAPKNETFPDAECTYLKNTYGAECSPRTDGPCCSDECSFIKQGESYMCSKPSDGECWQGRYCDGLSAQCPSTPIEGLLCKQGRKSCKDGSCTESLCYHVGRYDLEECECECKIYACQTCCRNKWTPDSCFPLELYLLFGYRIAYDFNINMHDINIYKPPGIKCKDKHYHDGRCNEYGICANVGPTKQLPHITEDTSDVDITELSYTTPGIDTTPGLDTSPGLDVAFRKASSPPPKAMVQRGTRICRANKMVLTLSVLLYVMRIFHLYLTFSEAFEISL